MSKKIVTFGEIMLRLTTPDNLRIQQSRDFLVNYGGSEANVAISIANFGGEVEYITRLPDNALGETCIAELRSHNIGTKHILFGGHRLGTYYMEKAAAMRNSNVIYDRENSSFSELKPGMINWREIFKDAAIFHWSGIDAALTPGRGVQGSHRHSQGNGTDHLIRHQLPEELMELRKNSPGSITPAHDQQ